MYLEGRSTAVITQHCEGLNLPVPGDQVQLTGREGANHVESGHARSRIGAVRVGRAREPLPTSPQIWMDRNAESIPRYRVPMTIAGIVLAGGSGSRVQRDVNKVFLPLGERDMLGYSLATMESSPLIDEIVLVVREEDRQSAERLLEDAGISKIVAVVPGGESRHQSESHGLEAVATGIEAGTTEIVVIHDGARPFMTTDLLHATIEAARRSGGGVPGLPIEGPVYERSHDNTSVGLPSHKLRRMQTPQAFRAQPLLAAYRQARQERHEGVDTAATAARYTDLAIEVVDGDPRNIKVTFVEDIFRAEEHAAAFRTGAWTD
jgi:2-C-methyl-D-erythritol 4-phosphate cytidylyltransferase